MLDKFHFHDFPHGINKTTGICGNQKFQYQHHEATAYAVNEDAMITIATVDVRTLIFIEIDDRIHSGNIILGFSEQFSSRFFNCSRVEIKENVRSGACVFNLFVGK